MLAKKMRKFLSLSLIVFVLSQNIPLALAAKNAVSKNTSAQKSVTQKKEAVSTAKNKQAEPTTKKVSMTAGNDAGAPPDTSYYYNNKFDKLKTLDNSKGNFQTNLSTGAATYQYPLFLPPGRNNLAPSLSLNYSSQNKNSGSFFGFGWDLTLGEIKRINTHGSEQLYNRTDFSLDLFGSGGNLIATALLPNSQLGEYAAQIENSFLKIKLEADLSWKITDKNGTKYTFGKTTASRLYHGESSPSEIFLWKLDEIRDTNDNFIKFTYAKENYPNAGGQIYPETIIYTGHGSTDGPITVRFIRSDRVDPFLNYEPLYYPLNTQKIISRIDIEVSGESKIQRQYLLNYESNSDRKRSLLTSIQEKGEETLTLPETIFEYTVLGNESFQLYTGSGGLPANIFFVETNMPGYEAPVDNGVRILDVNGDSRPDIIKGFVDYNNQSHAELKKILETYINKSYVDADGVLQINFVKDAINYQVDAALVGYTYEGQWIKKWEAHILDSNGDYFPDLLDLRTKTNDLNERIGFLNNKVNGWVGTTVRTLWDGQLNGSYDVNGDGLSDSITSRLNKQSAPNPPTLSGSVYLNPSGTWSNNSPLPLTDENDKNYGTTFIDANGDGLTDAAEGQLYSDANNVCTLKNRIFLNTGKGWQTEPSLVWQFPAPLVFSFPKMDLLTYQDLGLRVMDYNGDGLMDVIMGDSMINKNYCASNLPNYGGLYLNNGVSGWYPSPYASTPTQFVGEGTKHSDFGARIVDINGDSLDDVIVAFKNFYNGTTTQKIYLNKNQPPDLLKKVTTPYKGSVEIKYKPSTFDQKDGKILNIIPFTMQTVASVKRNDNNGVTGTSTYVYKNGRFNFYDSYHKEFGGFGEVTETIGNRVSTYYFYTGDPASERPFDLVNVDYSYNKYYDGQIFYRYDDINHYISDFFVMDNGKKRLIKMSPETYPTYNAAKCMPFWAYGGDYTGLENNFYSLFLHPYYGEIDAIPTGDPIPYTADMGAATAERCGYVLENNPPIAKLLPPAYSLRGKLYRTVIKDFSGNIYAQSFSKWEVTDLNPSADDGSARYFPQISAQIEYTYDGQGSHRDKAVSFEYDHNTGNLLKETQLGEVTANPDTGEIQSDLVLTDNVIKEISYALNAEKNIVSLPKEVMLKSSDGNILKQERFYYDEKLLSEADRGNLTKQSSYLIEENKWIDSVKKYDVQIYPNEPAKQFGLLKEIYDPRGNKTTFYYESEGPGYPNDYPTSVQANIYPVAVVMAKTGLVYWSHYDLANGQVDFFQDANGKQVKKTFDALGRVIKTILYDPINTKLNTNYQSFTYNDTAFPPSVYFESYGGTEEDNIKDPMIMGIKYFDGLGRVIQEKSSAEKIAEVYNYFTKSYQYDEFGQLKYETFQKKTTTSNFEPVDFSTAPKTEYFYDAIGRIIKSNIADFGYTQKDYSQWSVTIKDYENPRGGEEYFSKYKYVYDAFNRLVETNEFYKKTVYVSPETIFKTAYKYDLLGSLMKITDAKGNIRNFTYDSFGRQKALDMIHKPEDSDFGQWFYVYDEASNIIAATDPNGNTVNYTYDELNRMKTEDFQTTKTEYFYDGDENKLAERNVLGRLSKIKQNDQNYTSYNYDGIGSITAEIKTIDNITFLTKFYKDALGRLKTIIYPDESQVSHLYNYGGALNIIRLKEKEATTEETLINSITYNERGQVSQIAYGNGMKRDYGYYDKSHLFRLEYLRLINVANASIQQLYYNVDHAGNITGLSDNSNLKTKKNQTFKYDSLGRLKLDDYSDNTPLSHRTYEYDALGNFSYNEAISRDKNQNIPFYYEYTKTNDNNANPHATSRIQSGGYTLAEYFYDKNGNLIKERNLKDQNYEKINNYEYNYKNQLVSAPGETYTYDASGNRTTKVTNGMKTVYVNQYFDKDNHAETNYIYAGSQMLASLQKKYNQPPIANAGLNQSLKETGKTVTLDGGLSSDLDNDALTYSWTLTKKPEASTAVLSNADKQITTFVPDLYGEYSAELKVNDGYADSSIADEVKISVWNNPPFANAGPDQKTKVGLTVALDGSKSYDPDNDKITGYSWTVKQKPADSAAKLNNPNNVSATFVPDKNGSYIFSLIVMDGIMNSQPDEVVATTENRAPTANAGPDQTVKTGSKVTLNGSLSSDQDNDKLQYKWRIISKPTLSKAVLSSTTVVNPTFTADKTGTYKLGLKVYDGKLWSAEDAVIITAKLNIADLLIAGLDFILPRVSAYEPIKIPVNTSPIVAEVPSNLISKNLYYHFDDHLGSSNIIADRDGKIVEVTDYYPYGEVRVKQSFEEQNFQTRKQFTGKEMDSTGLTYFGARYYDAKIGRFMSADPIALAIKTNAEDNNKRLKILEDPQKLNLYSYAKNNPMKFIDPTGEAVVEFPSRALWAIGIFSYVQTYRGWKTTAEMFLHSLSDNPTPWIKDNNSYVAQEIKNSSEYQKILLPNIQEGILNNKLSGWGSLELKSTDDLANSLNKVNYTYRATENKDGSYTINMQIFDYYDFHKKEYDSFKNLINNVANNVAYLDQTWMQAIQTYAVKIIFQDTVKIDKSTNMCTDTKSRSGESEKNY